ERGVLAGDPELLHPVAAAPPVVPHTWTPQYQLPREVAGVVGRDRFVDELVDRLTGPGPVPVVAIYGGAGVGKSTLAVTVAHRVAGSFPDGQWYVRLDGAGRVGRDPVEVLGELLPELRALTAESPLRERFWGLLMVVLYRSGRPAEALEAYRTARRLLIDVLGIEPGPELRRLERGVLAGDPELLHPVAAAPPVVPHT
ncbi:BTAD domain-containing putative transcriptional regulator, partial [Micromonospora zhanjiangensis]